MDWLPFSAWFLAGVITGCLTTLLGYWMRGVHEDDRRYNENHIIRRQFAELQLLKARRGDFGKQVEIVPLPRVDNAIDITTKGVYNQSTSSRSDQ